MYFKYILVYLLFTRGDFFQKQTKKKSYQPQILNYTKS